MHHTAVFSVGPRAPLELRQVPTPTPVGDQVRVLYEWTSTQPFDLHKADGGLAQYPEIMGDGSVGTVVEVGDQVKRLQVGDKVSFPTSFYCVRSTDSYRFLDTCGRHLRSEAIRPMLSPTNAFLPRYILLSMLLLRITTKHSRSLPISPCPRLRLSRPTLSLSSTP